MAKAATSFEAIDRRMQSLNLTRLQRGRISAKALSVNPQQALQQVCQIYTAVRPILVALSKLPFIPAKWRAVITTFIKYMDMLCPGAR